MPGSSGTLADRRVLVVDDEPGIREVLVAVLANHGYDVRSAPNGAVALEVLADWQADLILLDLLMPVMNGWAFHRAQLANERLAPIPVAVLSSSSGLWPESAGPPVAAALTKPFSLPQLLDVVAALTALPDLGKISPDP